MNLIILTGPPAVGKMTVGQALSAKTGYKLLHNHMTVDPVYGLFPLDSPPFWPLVLEIRNLLFQAALDNNLPGLIYTFVWAYDKPHDLEIVNDIVKRVSAKGGKTVFVEMHAGLDVRLVRNRTENRLLHKRLQRENLEGAEEFLHKAESENVLQTCDKYPAPYPKIWLKIDNTDISPDEVADRIIERFELPRV